MKRSKAFLKDDKARIPFSVIGVFLILGSSFTAAYVTRLERDKAVEVASTIDFNEVENLIKYAEADMSTALNIAGLKGLKHIGIWPTITEKTTIYGDNPADININVVKNCIMEELNIYLTGNYLYNKFTDGRYAINVIIPSGETYPITSWDDIYFTALEMELKRLMNIPIITPPEYIDLNSYYTVSTPIDIEIKDLDNNNVITTRTVNISSIITSRFLLLKNLVNEYIKTINGVHELWSFTTIISNIYSLARGYLHYRKGKPENVVDNDHLSLIVNSGLLLEEAYTFGSVDPMAIVELGIKSYDRLKKKSKGGLDIVNFDMTNPGGFEVDTGDVSQGSANTDAGEDFNATIPQTPEINLSEIAERPLYDYNKVILWFEKPDGTIFSVIVETDQDKIREKVEEELNKKNTFLDIEKDPASLQKNSTTLNKINDIIDTIYSAEMETHVSRPSPIITYGGHAGYPIDNGSEPWEFVSMSLVDTISKPTKGNVNPVCTMYGEVYDVTWTRNHYWSKKINGTWYNITVIDTKFEDDVTIEILLNYYSNYNGTKNDVIDVYYENVALNDPNLEDTVQKYIDNFYTPNKDDIIKTGLGSMNIEIVTGNYEPWVEDETWDALKNICADISKIKQDPSLNSTNYPDTFLLLELIKNDLLQKFNDNISSFLEIDLYKTGTLFDSVGKKAVYSTRDWYVYKVRQDIIDVFDSMDSQINDQIQNAIDDHASGQGFDVGGVRDNLSSSAMGALQNSFAIPLGFDMDLTRKDSSGYKGWKETIRLAVDQYPDYLDEKKLVEYNGKKFTTLKLKNICTLGPTGLPILPPTPVTPWIITINVWIIEVTGEYCEFKVIDSGDETIFNPIFGHDPQIYIRNESETWDVDENIKVGFNENIKFEYTTVAFGIVPSWGFMVGDFGAYSEESEAK